MAWLARDKNSNGMWIARDIEGRLHLFASKPIRYVDHWIPYIDSLKINLPTEFYPEVTWLNEPRELILK